MESVFSQLVHLTAARALFAAIAVSFIGIAGLLAFIIGRRWIRGRYFRRRDAATAWIRQHWYELVSGTIPEARWAHDKLLRSAMESLLLDQVETSQETGDLVDCLRRSGILDERTTEARSATGWRRRAALVSLGRTRAPEALPALAEALDSDDMETRIAAVRGLGKLAMPAAGRELLQRIDAGELDVPWSVVKNALFCCCASDPSVLARYLEATAHETAPRPERLRVREMLARVLAEIADAATWQDLVVMAADPLPEVRGSAARGLARAPADLALSPLAELAADPEWFVRLRAVVALATFVDQGAMPVLLRRLTDRERLVRQRAAWALIRSQNLPQVLEGAVRVGDNYGLQALVSELDRRGSYEPVVQELRRGARQQALLADELENAHNRLEPQPAGRDQVFEATSA
jgi:HEAT repeat protein